MYTRIPELEQEDVQLTPMDGEQLWVGISDADYTLPIDREQAKKFRRCYIYIYNGRRVFELLDHNKNKTTYYYVPDEDLARIEKHDYSMRLTQDMQ